VKTTGTGYPSWRALYAARWDFITLEITDSFTHEMAQFDYACGDGFYRFMKEM
jgi:hypothetical protein